MAFPASSSEADLVRRYRCFMSKPAFCSSFTAGSACVCNLNSATIVLSFSLLELIVIPPVWVGLKPGLRFCAR